MKKYMLFVGSNYYPDDGINGFLGFYNSVEDAMEQANLTRIKDWAQVINIGNGDIVFYRENADGIFEEDCKGSVPNWVPLKDVSLEILK